MSECGSSPCGGNGECIEEVGGGYICVCSEGYTGAACETDINYCDSTPCNNGGTCTELDTGFSCQCSSAYTGVTCGEGEMSA